MRPLLSEAHHQEAQRRFNAWPASHRERTVGHRRTPGGDRRRGCRERTDRRAGAPVSYNVAEIQKRVPGLADVSRLIDEETTKLVTDVRPFNEWNGFLGELKSADLDAWSTAYTAQDLNVKKRERVGPRSDPPPRGEGPDVLGSRRPW